tara:strand:- start:11673 stop:12386 length:714 start_codon:yes stop_codon:yes gene_type:complete
MFRQGKEKMRTYLAVLLLGSLLSCGPETMISQRELDIAACSGIELVNTRVACYDNVARSMGIDIFDPADATTEIDQIATTLGINTSYPNPEYVPREMLKMARSLDIDISHIREFDTQQGVLNILDLSRQVLAVKPKLDFLELIENFANPRKLAIEMGVRTKRISTMREITAGQLGIPRDVEQTDKEHGAQVADATIAMMWKNDASDLQGVTYILSLESMDYPFQWSVGGTCLEKDLC